MSGGKKWIFTGPRNLFEDTTGGGNVFEAYFDLNIKTGSALESVDGGFYC